MIKDRLKQARNSLRMSQSKFAAICGIPQTTYSKYENGGSIPEPIMVALAKFGFNLHWLITGEGPMYHKESKEIVADVVEEIEAGYSPIPLRTGRLISQSGRIEAIEVGKGELLLPILNQRLSAGVGQEWLVSDF